MTTRDATAHIYTTWSELRKQGIVNDNNIKSGTGWDEDAKIMYSYLNRNFSSNADVKDLIEIFEENNYVIND